MGQWAIHLLHLQGCLFSHEVTGFGDVALELPQLLVKKLIINLNINLRGQKDECLPLDILGLLFFLSEQSLVDVTDKDDVIQEDSFLPI